MRFQKRLTRRTEPKPLVHQKAVIPLIRLLHLKEEVVTYQVIASQEPIQKQATIAIAAVQVQEVTPTARNQQQGALQVVHRTAYHLHHHDQRLKALIAIHLPAQERATAQDQALLTEAVLHQEAVVQEVTQHHREVAQAEAAIQADQAEAIQVVAAVIQVVVEAQVAAQAQVQVQVVEDKYES